MDEALGQKTQQERKSRCSGRGTRSLRGLALGLLAVALLLTLAACDAPAAGFPRFRAVSIQPGDGITIEDATDDVTIDITSERGVGSMEIERAGRAPKTLTLNFQLKGLEEVRFGWGDTAVTVHVSSGTGDVREEASPRGGPSTAIDSTSPYWIPVRIEAENAQIPLKSGYFTLAAPPAFLEAQPQRFSIKWIDFYR